MHLVWGFNKVDNYNYIYAVFYYHYINAISAMTNDNAYELVGASIMSGCVMSYTDPANDRSKLPSGKIFNLTAMLEWLIESFLFSFFSFQEQMADQELEQPWK